MKKIIKKIFWLIDEDYDGRGLPEGVELFLVFGCLPASIIILTAIFGRH